MKINAIRRKTLDKFDYKEYVHNFNNYSYLELKSLPLLVLTLASKIKKITFLWNIAIYNGLGERASIYAEREPFLLLFSHQIIFLSRMQIVMRNEKWDSGELIPSSLLMFSLLHVVEVAWKLPRHAHWLTNG